ncbi:MAG TPA: hypothetical protein PLA68_15780, partial [Panacibacter sp.]|nr:hypothetical protein [Panacibacter sp.]
MRIKSTIRILEIALSLTFFAAGKSSAQSNLPSLKEIFKNDFLIGTALNRQQIEEKDSGAVVLVRQQF